MLSLAACAEPASVGQQPTPGTDSTGSYAADAVVLRVSYEGGMLPAESVPELPFWSLLGDGRVVTRGPETAIYPGQAVPNVLVAKVSGETVDRITTAAREAGIDGQQRDYGDPPVADASTTVFRLTDERGSVETRVYALAEGTPDVRNEHRERIRAFLAKLTDLDGWLGAGSVSAEQAYEPTSVAIYARPYQREAGAGEPPEQVVTWTGPDPAAGTETRAGTCTVLTGATLTATMPELRKANTLTRWRTATGDWAFQVRPLLPDERTCADGLR